jgi:4-hydroxy-tetrahydrodipicolinate reductase
MKIAIHGASGRMGRAVLSLVMADGRDSVVGAVAEPGSPEIGRDLGEVHGLTPVGVIIQDSVDDAVLGADVVIDFSLPPAMPRLIRACKQAGVALVSGTTGLDESMQAQLRDAAEKVGVVWAPNFSVGIQVLSELVQQAARRLGSDFDVEIVEVHHNAKADSPSGTAARLAHAVMETRDGLQVVSGRQGKVGARGKQELGVFSLRGGDVIGDHTVHLFGPGERLELTHRATARSVFARGALFAARRLLSKPAGLYTLADMLG